MKPFDRDEYDKYNGPAVDAFRKWLEGRGVFTQSTENYGADIRAMVPHVFEIEVKEGWQGEWPKAWATVHIPERKRKVAKVPARTFFVILRADLAFGMMARGDRVVSAPVVQLDTSAHLGDRFFDVPRAAFTLIRVGQPVTLANSEPPKQCQPHIDTVVDELRGTA